MGRQRADRVRLPGLIVNTCTRRLEKLDAAERELVHPLEAGADEVLLDLARPVALRVTVDQDGDRPAMPDMLRDQLDRELAHSPWVPGRALLGHAGEGCDSAGGALR